MLLVKVFFVMKADYFSDQCGGRGKVIAVI
jgi:hypothetical protein